MMYHKLIVPVDHGNQNMKTENTVFTSGLLESDCKPMLGDYVFYKNRYYSLTDQRIPYMRNKTEDERFFILTLFAIVMEAERMGAISESNVLQVSTGGITAQALWSVISEVSGLFSEQRHTAFYL